MKNKKVKYAIIVFALLFVCISIPRIFAIFKETKSKELNLIITHPSFTVTFNPNQGTVDPTSKTVVYGHNYDILPTPNRTGFSFDGWYDALNDGNKIINSTTVNRAENHTLFARWIANQLIVNGETNIDLTYSTSSQTATINEATNGTGNYTYIEKSETNGEDHTNYISLNGTEVTVAANTPAGTYTYVVTVTDTVSGSNIDVTYTITIGRMKINLPDCGTFIYNKTEQTLLSSTTEYSVVNNTAINAGNYDVGVTPTSNYEWNDSTTSQKDVTCTIDPYDIGVSGNATVVPTSNKTYNGNSITPTPAVMVPLPTIMSSYTLTSSELSYTYSNNINVGEATITINGEGNYTGTITQNFIIEKADGYINLSEINKSVSYGTNSVTFTITSSHGGTHTVTDNNGTAASSIVGNTITVSDLETLASGTTVVVTVTSAGTNNYNEATATYTINITNAILLGGSVTITGNNIVGETLTANVTDTSPVASYSYEWYTNTSPSTSGGTKINGATSSTYQVTASDMGKYIYVVVTASKANYTSTSFSDVVDVTNNVTEIVKSSVAKPSSTYCKNLEYNGSSQVLTNAAETGYAFYNNSGTNASSYTVTARLQENYIWSDNTTADVTFNCSISKKTITLTASSETREYNGLPLTNNTCTSTGLISGDTPTCTMTNASTITNVGSQNNEIDTYTITNGLGDVTSNYHVTPVVGLLTVTEATPTVALTTKNSENRVYTGSSIAASTATVTLVNNEAYNGTVTYTYYTDSNCTVGATTVAPTNVGTYYVKASTEAFGNYNAGESYCVNHSILPKKATITTEDSTKTLTYKTSDTVAYTYDGDGTLSCSSSDETKVTCSIDTSNHLINIIPVEATINPITITLSAGNGMNYTTADDITFTVIVNKYTPIVNLTPKTGMNWNNSPQAANTATVSLTNGETYTGIVTYTYYTDSNCTNGATTTIPTLAGNYYVKATTESSLNYNIGESACVNHTISVTTPTVSLTPKTEIYTGSKIAANTATVTPDAGGEVTYNYYSDNACSIPLEPSTVCRPATNLHTKICSSYEGYGCDVTTGIGNTITYGTLVNGTPKAGDAYDCDVNNDGVYDPTTERFYYLQTVGGQTSLIYSTNITGTNAYAYDSANENWHGPRTGFQYLPSTSTWSNPMLVAPGQRNIVSTYGGLTTTGGTIESFTYTGKAARFLTAAEVNNACGTTVGSFTVGELDSCTYLLEDLAFFDSETGSVYAYWLETPEDFCDEGVLTVVSYEREAYGEHANATSGVGIRPVITVPDVSAIDNTPINAGTYYTQASVEAVDSKTTSATSACVSHIIVQPSNSITNLSVDPTGVVSWVNSVNATGYEISIDGMNWTSVPAGTNITTVNYLNAIVAANGTRTVYVRALDSESAVIADSTVSTDVSVYEVTFNANNSSYGTLTPSTYNVIAGATYTTSGNTLTLQDGRTVTAKPTKEIGYITTVDSWSNNSGTITSPTTITANFNRDVKNITITFNSGSGEFDNSTTINVVNYTELANAMTKYSHTGNVDDNGVQSSVYGNYWTEANITGTERGDTTKAHVITIPGANSLTVDIYYNGEYYEYDWATVWAGSHPSYTALSNYDSSISGRLGGVQTGTYTVNGNSLTNMGHETYNIDGDSVTFGFVSDISDTGEGYGYYAIVTGVAAEYQSVGIYKVPLKNGDSFVGWNTQPDGSGTLYKTEEDLLKLEESTTLYAIFKSSYKLCKRATVLHTEQCLREDSTPYCQGAGYQYNETVTYGNTTTTSGVLTTGDAFDCDVNGDGLYDSETERFYYISRYDDASLTNLPYDERFVDDIAVLIYYSNTVGGVPGNTGIPYYDQGQNNMGPLTAISNLPTTSQWRNVNLYKEQRKILTNDGQDSTTSGSLPTSFSYSGYAARFLTAQEIYNGCSNGGTDSINAEFGLTQCKFLVENTMFTDPNNAIYGGWLETPYGNWNLSWHLCGEHNHMGYEGVNSTANGTRPVIDVPIYNIEY